MNIVSTFPVPVIDLPFLAHEINDAHRQAVFHGKSMLLEARRAGEHLLKAKEKVQHGEFKAWIEANCECSYRTARKYMQVVKLTKVADLGHFDDDIGIDAFLEAHSTPRPKAPEPAPTLTRDDAEYILKLHAVTERGGTENERDVAQRKLADFAGRFGMREDVAVDWAVSKVPDHGKSSEQIERDRAREELAASQAEAASLRAQLEAIQSRITQLRTDCTSMTREALEEAYIGLVLEREGFAEILKKKAA